MRTVSWYCFCDSHICDSQDSDLENPFPAGTIVTGDDFANRRDEVAFLREELRQGGRVFLLAYRRFGKTCLIHETLRRLQVRDHVLTAYVDLYRANSERELWELFANSLLAASRSPLTKLVVWATEFARGFRPRFSIDPHTQQPVVTLDAPRTPSELAEVRAWALELPSRLAQQQGRPIVVAFDEFQEIRAFDGARLEKTLRSAFQSHRGVGYLFAGSKPHLLREMAQEGNAFYRFGRLMELAPVAETHWVPYLTARFRRGSVDIAPEVVRTIVAYAEGIPYYVMRISRALWSRGVHAGRLKENDVQGAFDDLVAEGDQLFAEPGTHSRSPNDARWPPSRRDEATRCLRSEFARPTSWARLRPWRGALSGCGSCRSSYASGRRRARAPAIGSSIPCCAPGFSAAAHQRRAPRAPSRALETRWPAPAHTIRRPSRKTRR